MAKNKAIILDRDGTLIEDKNYAYKTEDLELLPGVIDGLKILQKELTVEEHTKIIRQNVSDLEKIVRI